MPEPIIEVSRVSKSFKLPHEKKSSLKSTFLSVFSIGKTFEKHTVLNDIDFQVNRGEFFGILGRNGSGKSTLLKLLAGIYYPNKGSVRVNGKLTPFIELGVGFNPELTGRENVFLNGALLGFSRKEVEALYADIVEFAELEKFMDQKLKNYSSGMQVRLAFSIAIRANSDILLIDEVLAVGDLDFQRKCYDYFLELKRKKQTVVLVTHDMSAVRRFCDRCIVIQDGKKVAEGKPESMAKIYEDANLRAAEERLKRDNQARDLSSNNTKAKITSVTTFNPTTKKEQNTFSSTDKIGVRLEYVANEVLESPSVGFIFQDQLDNTVFATNNKISKSQTKTLQPGDTLIYETTIDNVFTDGTYTITTAIESNDFLEAYDRGFYVHVFSVGGHQLAHAAVHPRHASRIIHRKAGN